MNDEKATATVAVSGVVGVRTRYLGPTNHRGSRVAVWRADGSRRDDPCGMVVPWDYALDAEANHEQAIATYLEAHDDAGHGWPRSWVMASFDDGYFAVSVDRTYPPRVAS